MYLKHDSNVNANAETIIRQGIIRAHQLPLRRIHWSEHLQPVLIFHGFDRNSKMMAMFSTSKRSRT